MRPSHLGSLGFFGLFAACLLGLSLQLISSERRTGNVIPQYVGRLQTVVPVVSVSLALYIGPRFILC
ncbi:hypothetical protein F5Y19DRAFT_434695 [Xylariaceae sp. FL1651]|nr:hypothetical protein F5Y19DRAFT_434695 [Xylariaceae sp. FL1651]